jgi:hypothetical protein
MDVKKIRVGMRVRYQSRRKEGRRGRWVPWGGLGKVSDVYTKLTGAWVVINDPSLNRYITLRPSQVELA